MLIPFWVSSQWCLNHLWWHHIQWHHLLKCFIHSLRIILIWCIKHLCKSTRLNRLRHLKDINITLSRLHNVNKISNQFTCKCLLRHLLYIQLTKLRTSSAKKNCRLQLSENNHLKILTCRPRQYWTNLCK